MLRLIHCCLKLLLLLVSMTSLAQSSTGEIAATNMITEFQHSFKVANPSARRDLVIAAIDNGLIKRGMPLKELRFMFAGDFEIFYPKSQNDKLRAVAFFEPAKPAPEPIMSAAQEGWYIDFVFSSDECLEYYSLSNLHK